MNWAAIHAVAEEVALWSTLVVNVTLISTAIPTAIAYARKVPRKRIERLAYICAIASFIVGTVTAASWMIFAPPSPNELQLRQMKDEFQRRCEQGKVDDDDIIMCRGF